MSMYKCPLAWQHPCEATMLGCLIACCIFISAHNRSTLLRSGRRLLSTTFNACMLGGGGGGGGGGDRSTTQSLRCSRCRRPALPRRWRWCRRSVGSSGSGVKRWQRTSPPHSPMPRPRSPTPTSRLLTGREGRRAARWGTFCLAAWTHASSGTARGHQVCALLVAECLSCCRSLLTSGGSNGMAVVDEFATRRQVWSSHGAGA